MGKKLYIIAGNLIDGNGAERQKNVFLEIVDGTITAIGPAEALSEKNISAVDDYSHCSILPALVDCSISLLKSPSVVSEVREYYEDAGLDKKIEMMEKHISYCHTYGVLGAVESNDISEIMGRYHEMNVQGFPFEIAIPYNPNVQEGPGDSSANYGDVLKIHFSSDIDDEKPTDILINYRQIGRLQKNRKNTKIVVVANGEEHVAEAMENGCDAIEQGYSMGEKNLKEMAARDVLWIPSVLRAKNGVDSSGSGGDVCCRFSQRYAAPGKAVPGAEEFWKQMLKDQLKLLNTARKLGVRTAVGTGAGSVGILHGESVAEEIKLFMKAGYSLEEAMKCASQTGAAFFGMNRLGALRVGGPATFLITRGSVKQLPRKLSYLEGIYIEGEPSVNYSKNPVKSVS